MSTESEIVRSLQEKFPSDPLALTDEERREELEQVLGPVAWPDFEVAMVAPGGWAAERTGAAGYADGWNDWLAPFESFRVEFEELVEGPDGIVQFVRQIGTPRGSEAEVENVGAGVFKFREGRIARLEFHLSRDDALASAGLDPQSSQP